MTELREVSRDEWLASFQPSWRARLHKRLAALSCRLSGHRWDTTVVDHGPGLSERITWCARCYLSGKD